MNKDQRVNATMFGIDQSGSTLRDHTLQWIDVQYKGEPFIEVRSPLLGAAICIIALVIIAFLRCRP